MNHARLAPGLLALVLGACSTPVSQPDVTPQDANAPREDAAQPDAGSGDAQSVSEAGSDASAVPFITEALECRYATPAGAGSGAMQRHAIDLARFPDALCNDGTGAVIHFRPFRGAANRNKWVIALRGGGGCDSGDTCAARYCGCSPSRAAQCPRVAEENRTFFTANNMTNDHPPLLPGTGIMLRDGGPTMVNPIQDYNQVQLQYCSSDLWSGTRRDAVVTATHPVTGAPVQYRLHFLGRRILDADIATLRQDGVAALVHNVGTSTPLPDLDDAEEIIFTGDSAGGAGLVNNLDRLQTELRASNANCRAGGACPLRVRGLMDASVGPDRSRLDWSATPAMTYARLTELASTNRNATHGFSGDESCVAWHRARSPGSEAVCADEMHVVRNHVTTPFFLRMAVADVLIMEAYTSSGARDPALGAITPLVFAQLQARELAQFTTLPTRAEEGAAMSLAPSVFAPLCTKHDTIWDTDDVYRSSVTPAGGAETRLFDVFEPWRATGATRAVVAASRMDSVCP